MPADPKRRLGRPPLAASARRSVQVPVRLTEEERSRYEAAAARLDTTLAEEARRAWERMGRRAAR